MTLNQDHCLAMTLYYHLKIENKLTLMYMSLYWNVLKCSGKMNPNRPLQRDVIPLDGAVFRVPTDSSCIETAIEKS